MSSRNHICSESLKVIVKKGRERGGGGGGRKPFLLYCDSNVFLLSRDNIDKGRHNYNATRLQACMLFATLVCANIKDYKKVVTTQVFK